MTFLAVVHCDAGVEVGGGHLRRSLTLIERLTAEGGDYVLALTPPAINLLSALDLKPHSTVSLEDSNATEIMRVLPGGCDVIVVDHYGLEGDFEAELRGWAREIVVIDDGLDRRHNCDILIDQNVGHTPDLYSGWVPDSATLLIGPSYALVRDEFVAERTLVVPPSAEAGVGRIAVIMGLTDPDNVTDVVLRGLLSLDRRIMVDVVLGAAAPHLDEVRQDVGALAHASLHISPPNLASILGRADIVISAAGSTVLELATLGRPMILIEAADNQRTVAEHMATLDAALNIGRWQSVTEERVAAAVEELCEDGNGRVQLAHNAARLCDGHGAQRAADAIRGRLGHA